MLHGPAKLPPGNLPKEALIERYKTHTCKCKVCSGALRNVRLARKVAAAAGIIASTLATAGCARPPARHCPPLPIQGPPRLAAVRTPHRPSPGCGAPPRPRRTIAAATLGASGQTAPAWVMTAILRTVLIGLAAAVASLLTYTQLKPLEQSFIQGAPRPPASAPARRPALLSPHARESVRNAAGG